MDAIHDMDDVLRLLDGLLPDHGGQAWDSFYADRDREVPFFVNKPDENLAAWFDSGALRPGRVLEPGCGAGRNAIYMAGRGCRVEAVDVSRESLAWARERAEQAGALIAFSCRNVFDLAVPDEAYQLIYDAGLLHHLPPHRRPGYLQRVRRALKPEGRFGLVCFNTSGGPTVSDTEIYKKLEMPWGIGYTEQRLRDILEPYFTILEFRPMQAMEKDSDRFGVDFCWVVLMEKPSDEEGDALEQG